MNLQKLLITLSNQEKNLKVLLKVVSDKKEALVNSDSDLLERIIKEEENILLKVQLAEEDRLQAMKILFNEYDVPDERYKLEILVNGIKNKVHDEIINQIEGFERRIKSNIEEITKVNHLNMVLIQQSRSLITQTINSLVNTNSRSILDRKG